MSDINRIHENTDFVIKNAGVTIDDEFMYDHGGHVQAGLEYHIHYTNDKKEVFMTGGIHNSDSKIITKIKGRKTSFKRYTELSNLFKKKYPSVTPPNPSESDYRLGKIKRYFAQIKTTTNGDIFEISEDDFGNQNSLYSYVSFDWRISGTFEEVSRDNQRTIENVNSELPGIDRKLNPTSLWQAPKNSPESLEKKVLLLRNS